ncbi:little elongation complex subunit 2 isoform X2 [Cololabis saira]|uniref:little elongation complex subunit 2 isoform X2 n=1 Tax=Cololabis saira TaxID=129043 RepID=UPI002AD2EA0F|nr:little elongation complex subunit 2 isoform X2 [Cololabis saira]
MEMTWDEHPPPDGPFFTRDLYEKHSLTPHIRELWAFLQSPMQNSNMKQECDVEAAEASSSLSIKDAAESKDNSCISSQVSCWESFDSDSCEDNGAKSTDDGKNGGKTRVKKEQVETGADTAYPEPRQPFPCLSSLSSTEQSTYVGYLMRKKNRNPPQRLKTRVESEVMQFMKYLQDVAKMSAEDYNFISQGAVQYSEEFFGACLEHIGTLPQFYQIHEMTSLTGGTFNPGLSLTFEKQLLAMGSVNITDHKIVPTDAQLASDYQTVSSEYPPAKKAKDMHAMISNDGNAEKLSACYEPHVCLTRDALLRLLDNHGPDFREQWELPVCVKVTPGKVNNRRKTVYIDSPLLKTEMPVRERSRIYHQESLKLSVINSGSRNVFHLMTERPVDVQQLLPGSKRSCVAAEDNGLNFEVDLSDLETFGETTTNASVTKKVQNEEDAGVERKSCPSSPRLSATQRSSEDPDKMTSSSQEEMDCSLTNTDSPVTQLAVSEAIVQNTGPSGPGPAPDSDEERILTADSDDEKLVIDDCSAAPETPSKPLIAPPSADPPVTLVPDPAPTNTDSSSPHKGTRSCRQPKRAKVTGDQLGEILRMQTAMFKSSSEAPTPTKSPSRPVAPVVPVVHAHPTSLVKPCVTSYLERHQHEDGETGAAPHTPAVANFPAAEHKQILSQELQACAEDEQDYEAPAEGNLFYKLYSLQDVLLLVRSCVFLTHTRNVGSGQNQHVPVHVLPKLEYQLSYGVECLTSGEACQLWTETLLHSSTASYTAHINAHTSKVALLRQLPDDWKQSISCEFKPSKSLNILHHLLKKLTGLDEGQYLIVHKAGDPFVTLLKAGRGSYNLQQVHGSAPQPPTSCHVPWIPVDPAVVLPFHRKHGRVPCTFPPKACPKRAKEGTNNSKGAQNSQSGQGKKKKKNKQKYRAGKRDRYIQNLIQKSV